MSTRQEQQPISFQRLFLYWVFTLIALVYTTASTSFEEWLWRLGRWEQSLVGSARMLYESGSFVISVAIPIGLFVFVLPGVVRMLIVPCYRRWQLGAFLLLLYLAYAIVYGLSVVGLTQRAHLMNAVTSTLTNWFSFVFILGVLVLLPLFIIAFSMRRQQRRAEQQARHRVSDTSD